MREDVDHENVIDGVIINVARIIIIIAFALLIQCGVKREAGCVGYRPVIYEGIMKYEGLLVSGTEAIGIMEDLGYGLGESEIEKEEVYLVTVTIGEDKEFKGIDFKKQ